MQITSSKIAEKIETLKVHALSGMYSGENCKDIIKKAMKIRYPQIPDNANEKLVSKLLSLDNNAVLQMGQSEIMVADLIKDLIAIIQGFIRELDAKYSDLF